MYKIIESLCYTYETKIILYVNYASMKKKHITIKKESSGSSLVVQQIKDLVLSLLCHKWLVWFEFSSWPGNFCRHSQKTKKKKKKGEFFSFIKNLQRIIL